MRSRKRSSSVQEGLRANASGWALVVVNFGKRHWVGRLLAPVNDSSCALHISPGIHCVCPLSVVDFDQREWPAADVPTALPRRCRFGVLGPFVQVAAFYLLKRWFGTQWADTHPKKPVALAQSGFVISDHNHRQSMIGRRHFCIKQNEVARKSWRRWRADGLFRCYCALNIGMCNQPGPFQIAMIAPSQFACVVHRDQVKPAVVEKRAHLRMPVKDV